MQLFPNTPSSFSLSTGDQPKGITVKGVRRSGPLRSTASSQAVSLCLWSLCGILLTCRGYAVSLTLSWDPSATATSYNVYQAIGTDPMSLRTNVVGGTIATVTGIPTNTTTRFQVTALNSAGESQPSNVATFTPEVVPPPTGALAISAPVLTATNLQRGQTLTATARFTNGTSAAVTVNEGWLTARQPGASNASGPFDDFSPGMAAQTVGPGGIVTLTASWIVRADAPFGTWQAHLAVKVDGTYNDGPNTAFNVVASPTVPPPAPTNLRAIQVGTRSIRMEWRGNVAASTEVERSEESNPFMKIATVPPGLEQFNDSNVRRHRDFRYRVRNVSSFATTSYSNELFYSSR